MTVWMKVREQYKMTVSAATEVTNIHDVKMIYFPFCLHQYRPLRGGIPYNCDMHFTEQWYQHNVAVWPI